MTEPHVVVDCSIDLQDGDSLAPLSRIFAAQLLEEVAARTLEAAGVVQPVSLSLVITGDDEIQALNRQFRQQDKPTDVLSFPLLEEPMVAAPAEQLWSADEEGVEGESDRRTPHPHFVTPDELEINLGDIVISWPTVVQQAARAGHDAIYELLYLLSHGVLHLIGYDDQTEAGYATMVHIQEAVLQTIAWSEQSA